MTSMRGLFLTDEGPQLLRDLPVLAPGPGEALVAVRLAGICATDLALIAGYKGGYRGVLGHEFVGEVVAAADAPAWVGRRVVGEINIGCGVCGLCKRGLGKHCPRRQSLGIIGRDGALADYLTLPVANLHRVPDEVSDDQAVFTEPLAAALQVLEQVHVGPETRAVVVGDGRLGLLISQVLALTGCDLTTVGKHPAKLALLAEWGAGRTLMSDDPGLNEPVDADVVVEATGSPAGFVSARRLVRPGGTLVLKSTYAGALPAFDASGLVVDEITLVGSRCGPFAPALRCLASNRVAVTPLIQARYSLDDGVAALTEAGRRGVLKVVVAP
jgi:threonine dehydrogenase-like Zn-dependent dehydrogenase